MTTEVKYHYFNWGPFLFHSTVPKELCTLLKAQGDKSRGDKSKNYVSKLAGHLKEEYKNSIKVLKKGVRRKPDFVDLHIVLTAAYAQSAQIEDAARGAQTVLRLHPFFEVESYGEVFRNSEDRAKIIDGLRKAGLK